MGSLYDESLGLFGNFGYKDQVYSIEWTYRNIKNFGGNPNKITIFGESAGGHSVALHLLNKTSLIAGGIAESPPLGLPLRTNESWGTLPITFSKQLGCDPDKLSPSQRLNCLMNCSDTDIVKKQKSSNSDDPQTGWDIIKNKGMPWTPTVQTDLIRDQPVLLYQKGDYNTKIPFIMGSNTGEGFLFIGPVVPYSDINTNLKKRFGKNDTKRIEDFYNISNADRDENLFETYGHMITDLYMRCPIRTVLLESLKYASKPENIGFYYHYNYIASFAEHVWYYKPLCWQYVCHTEELPMVFDPNATSIEVFPTPEEVLLAHQVQYYWANFAETGDPSQGKHGNNLNQKWINYGSDSLQQTLMMNTIGANGFEMVNLPDKTVCDFWDTLNYSWYNGTGNQLLY